MSIKRVVWMVGLPLVGGVALMALVGSSLAGAQESGGITLSASGDGVECDGGSCTVPLDGDFTLSIMASDPPSGGYIGIQTHLDYGVLAYSPTETAEEEITWPDNILPVRSPAMPTGTEGTVSHGGLTSLTPPFDLSDYSGALVSLSMTCTSDEQTVTTSLLPYGKENPQGTSYSVDEQTIVSASDSLDIRCGEVEPTDDGGEPTAEEEEPTVAPTGLPSTGTFAGGTSHTDTGLWVLIAGLGAMAAASFGTLAWRTVRNA